MSNGAIQYPEKTSISWFSLAVEGNGEEVKFWNRPVTQIMHFSITIRLELDRYASRPRAQTEVVEPGSI